MSEHAIQQINFHGKPLWARVGQAPSQTFVSVPPICRHLGLDASMQRRRIQSHPVLAERSCEFTLPSGRGEQPTLCIRLDALNLWLAMIQPNSRRDPELLERLVIYQRECADVLYQHFFGVVPLPAEAIERHEMAEVKRELRLVVDNTRILGEKVTKVDEKVDALSGQITAQGWQNADNGERTTENIKQAIDEHAHVLTQGQADLKAGIDQVNLDMSDVKRDTRLTANAIEAVRKHRHEPKPSCPPEIGQKFIAAIRKAKQGRFDF